MNIRDHIPTIVKQFGLSAADFRVDRVGSGYIHHTYKLSGTPSYILQRVNKNVFTRPGIIAANIRHAATYLKAKHPNYLFLTPIPSLAAEEMVYDTDQFPWRLFPYFDNTYTVDKVSTAEEAFSAAAEFARLSNYLDEINTSLFKPTIDRFHDLSWRWEQFESSLRNAKPDRTSEAADAISSCRRFSYLVDRYRQLVTGGSLRVRITHNDTKINNILFDATTGKAVCAIDLDTLMPGYFIYDLGDMVRTFVSPVDEEERDLLKVIVRRDIFESLMNGYLSQMGVKLNAEEKAAIPFSGMMMTYIMALRMLTDFLNGDIYYQIRYPGQNLVRARNQLKLLQELENLQ